MTVLDAAVRDESRAAVALFGPRVSGCLKEAFNVLLTCFVPRAAENGAACVLLTDVSDGIFTEDEFNWLHY